MGSCRGGGCPADPRARKLDADRQQACVLKFYCVCSTAALCLLGLWAVAQSKDWQQTSKLSAVLLETCVSGLRGLPSVRLFRAQTRWARGDWRVASTSQAVLMKSVC